MWAQEFMAQAITTSTLVMSAGMIKIHRNKVAKIVEKIVKVRDVMSTRAEAPKRKARQ